MVIDAAGLGLREGVVSFGDLDELFRGGFIATAEMGGVSLGLDSLCRVGWLVCDSGAGEFGQGAGASLRILIRVVFLAEETVGFLDLSI